MFVDFVMNGKGHGEVGEALGQVRFDPNMLRPFIDNRGKKCVMVNTGQTRVITVNGKQVLTPLIKKMLVADLQRQGIDNAVWNATTLRKEAWISIQDAVVKATRQRLRAWSDLMNASSFGGFNGMAKMTHEYQAMTDPGEAVVDMDGITDGRTDTPLFKLRSIPLPITHSDFWFSEREIAVSRNSGTPLDTTMAEAAGRRVAEMIEKTLIGVETGVTYGTQTAGVGAHDGTSTVYGYTNYPNRVLKIDLNTPTGANPEAIMTDVLEMVETMQSNGFFGPYMLYTSTGYSRFLNDDYFRSGSTSAVRSLRQRIMEIDGIQDIRRLDYLTSGYQMILVQMDSEVVQAINGMDITTVQWDSQGGMRKNFKVMAIQVPLIKAPYNGVSGIIHATTS